jgi:hypothetical protein
MKTLKNEITLKREQNSFHAVNKTKKVEVKARYELSHLTASHSTRSLQKATLSTGA